MWELDYKESWVLKNLCFWTVVLEKTLEIPLDCKEIQPVPPKDQFWIFIGRSDAKSETPILWPSDVKSWLTGKDPDAGKDWRQEKKEMTEDEMVGWHYWLNGHEFEQNLGDGEGQGSLVCCGPWGHSPARLSDWTATTKPLSLWCLLLWQPELTSAPHVVKSSHNNSTTQGSMHLGRSHLPPH